MKTNADEPLSQLKKTNLSIGICFTGYAVKNECACNLQTKSPCHIIKILFSENTWK